MVRIGKPERLVSSRPETPRLRVENSTMSACQVGCHEGTSSGALADVFVYRICCREPRLIQVAAVGQAMLV